MDNDKIVMISSISFNEAEEKTADYMATLLDKAGADSMTMNELLLHSMLIGLTMTVLKTYLIGDEKDIASMEKNLSVELHKYNELHDLTEE